MTPERLELLNHLRRARYMQPDPASSDHWRDSTPGQPVAIALNIEPVQHSSMVAGLSAISSIHARGQEVKGEYLALITGQSGAGKSFLAEFYQSLHPVISNPDRDITPVIYVETPSKPTVASLMTAILTALKDLDPMHGSKGEMNNRILKRLVTLGVELILIDEFQHFGEHGHAAMLEVSNWLKTLVIRAKIPIILFGLPKCESTIRSNQQLNRRVWDQHYIEPFNNKTETAYREYRSVLKLLHTRVTIPAIEFHKPQIADRFLMASEGLMTYIIKIIDTAIEIANLQRREIDLSVLALAFKRSVWPQAPELLNPFLTKEPMRSLRRRDEPFEQWDATFGRGECAWPTKQ
jgi:type II secretory pathway predicted ATPase ExeA